MKTCKHATPTRAYNICSLGLYGGRPSPGVCARCPKFVPASRGLGDTIAKITKAVGIKPCSGCNKRKDKLNKLWPYKKKGE